ncbi:hypothetical protein TrRE_jg6420, partial [Triparma retinervis]
MTSNLHLPPNNPLLPPNSASSTASKALLKPSPLTSPSDAFTSSVAAELSSCTTVTATALNAVLAPLTVAGTLHFAVLPALFPEVDWGVKLVVVAVSGFGMLVTEVVLWVIRTGMPGYQVITPCEVVSISGSVVKISEDHVYAIINKPKGVISGRPKAGTDE